MTPPPRLFARPWLGDALRALGLAAGAGAVFSFPFWLPTRWVLAVMLVLGSVALWLVAFLQVRLRRDMRRWAAEDGMRQAQWEAERQARQRAPDSPA